MAFRGFLRSSLSPRLAYELLCVRESMEEHMSERRDPTSRIHLCDCNRSFALDAGRLAAGTDVAMQCHHALCGVELPALQTSLAGGKTVHVACTQETALFGELAEEAGAGERIRFFNLREHADKMEMNVNMISCAGQATIPIVHAVSRVQGVEYAEIIASLASKSVGPGTRANLDEFTYTTSNAIKVVGGARTGKAMAIINPAEPPLIMRNTIFCVTDEKPDEARIAASVLEMIKEVQKYVPGYRLVNGPVFDETPRGHRVSVFMEVAGLGDYLPKYAGNLDIMTAAATRTAEMFAEEILAGKIQLKAVEPV